MTVSRRHFIGSAAVGAGAGLVPAAAVGESVRDGKASSINALSLGVSAASRLDQSAEIQKAFDEAISRGLPLFLPAGTYLASNLKIQNSVTIIGVPGQSILEFSGDSKLLTLNGARHVVLQGLTFRGERLPLKDMAYPGLVFAEDLDNLNLVNCTISASAAIGLAMHRCSGIVSHCVIDKAADSAIFSMDANGLDISHNQVSDCGNNGILIWRSKLGEDGSIVSHNRVERIGAAKGGTGQNGNGINMFRAGNVVVTNNRVTDCAYSAVRCNSGSGCQIMGNSCSRLGEVAIYVEFAFEGAVVTSNFVDGAAGGISITNFDQGGRMAVCANNVVRDIINVKEDGAGERGFGISVEADTVVQGNVVENARVVGLELGWGPHLRDLSATGNIVRNCPIGISFSTVEKAGHVLVANNLISGSSKGAIYGMRWKEVVTGDLGKNPEKPPSNVTLSSNTLA